MDDFEFSAESHDDEYDSYERRRGPWLTAAIIYVALYGVVLINLVVTGNRVRAYLAPDALWLLLVAIGIAHLVAAFALWRWQFWGLYLFLAVTLAEIGLSMLATGSSLVVFARIIPFAVVGYIIRPKWEHFDGW